jgi:hypothetical protein
MVNFCYFSFFIIFIVESRNFRKKTRVAVENDFHFVVFFFLRVVYGIILAVYTFIFSCKTSTSVINHSEMGERPCCERKNL